MSATLSSPCRTQYHYERSKVSWVDRYLIHLTISEKFLITFWCPWCSSPSSPGICWPTAMIQAMQLQVDQLKGGSDPPAGEPATDPYPCPPDLIAHAWRRRRPSQQGDIYRYGASAGQAGVVSRHPGYEVTTPSGMVRAPRSPSSRCWPPCWPSSPFILSVTFCLGALSPPTRHCRRWRTAISPSGSISSRWDEFSILAGSIDTFTDRQHKIVQLVEESADALTLAADEFREHASDGEQLARAQRQHGLLAAAMEQMSAAIREVARNANDTLLQTRQSSDEATHAGHNGWHAPSPPSAPWRTRLAMPRARSNG